MLVVGLIPPFVATLGTLGIARDWRSSRQEARVSCVGDALPARYDSRPLGLPFSIVIALRRFSFSVSRSATALAVRWRSRNRESLVLAGVKANRYHVGIYVLAGVMAGVAALL